MPADERRVTATAQLAGFLCSTKRGRLLGYVVEMPASRCYSSFGSVISYFSRLTPLVVLSSKKAPATKAATVKP